MKGRIPEGRKQIVVKIYLLKVNFNFLCGRIQKLRMFLRPNTETERPKVKFR